MFLAYYRSIHLLLPLLEATRTTDSPLFHYFILLHRHSIVGQVIVSHRCLAGATIINSPDHDETIPAICSYSARHPPTNYVSCCFSSEITRGPNMGKAVADMANFAERPTQQVC
jgi:hypothetical protein